MDEYNERRRISWKKKNSFPGTRGFGACSSKVLLTANQPELENVSGRKRKRGSSFNKQLKNSSSVIVNSKPDTLKDHSSFAIPSKGDDCSSSFDKYMESNTGASFLNYYIENIVVNEEDVAETRKTWKERVETTEYAWKEISQCPAFPQKNAAVANVKDILKVKQVIKTLHWSV
ncbi:hypothetical protein OUZ56_032803 [Daphnia magna]|uniref:Uncharacterized protein n=1 Tax=Daphnia magna TaxID=35525 RepID=A0ABQ9ZX67_9CRUS|nr:hypothetical protein OUZ56_032803 [Daphnia magna]